MREVTREQTLTILRRLKADRTKIVLQFLQDARLLGRKSVVIDLSGADLSGDDLREGNLSGADLSGADLSGANLTGADLSGATVTQEQLAQAKSLAGATMPNDVSVNRIMTAC